MSKIVQTLVGVAAALYIGQFAWSFKVAADVRKEADIARAQQIIDDVLHRACSSEDRLKGLC